MTFTIANVFQFQTELNNAAQDYGKDKRPCEYFDLAGEDGLIHYKGATFVCDKERNRLTLGDCSDESKCIRVKLSKGGSLLWVIFWRML